MDVKDVYGKVKSELRDILITDDIFWNNEIEANMLLAKVLVFSAIILIATNLLNIAGIYQIPKKFLESITAQGLFELLIPAVLCFYYKGQKRWLKWLMIIMMTIVYARVYTAISYRTAILMVIPVLISCRYYSRKLTEVVGILTTVFFFLAAVFSVKLGGADMNNVIAYSGNSAQIHETIELASDSFQNASVGVQLQTVLLRSFLPSYILFWIASIAAFNISFRGRNMILEQDEISQNHSKVETELSMAKQIQERALPLVHELPKHQEFDIAATMNPAKAVGGDFYDIMFIDDTHVAMIIADVSGKGVPAALFMMVSKILLDNRVMLGGSPGKILEDVNIQLCEKQMEDMFVSVWLGILDLSTGHMITANAGHEYPIFSKADKNFEIIKDKHGLVLGGFSGIHYKETEFDMEPGDTLYVYTDGVAEANNINQEQFGLERTVQCLNKHKHESMETLLLKMKEEIDLFADGAEQFDDITMLGFQFKKYKNL